MATKTNLTANQGETFIFNTVFKDQAGVAFDFTTWEIFFTVKKNTNGSTLLSKNITDHLDPTHGISQIVMSATDTEAFSGQYQYEIRAKIGDTVYTPLTGYITFDGTLRQTAAAV